MRLHNDRALNYELRTGLEVVVLCTGLKRVEERGFYDVLSRRLSAYLCKVLKVCKKMYVPSNPSFANDPLLPCPTFVSIRHSPCCATNNLMSSNTITLSESQNP